MGVVGLRRFSLVVAATCVLAPPALTAPKTRLADQIDQIAAIALQQSRTAGFSIGIAVNGQTIFEKGYGHTGGNPEVAATGATIYHIDSVTKNITAAAILLLAEQGKLSLDDPLRKYVPELSLPGRDVRIRNLLNHTSGIKSFTSLSNWDDAKKMSAAEILALIPNQPADFSPGESWRYSNSGFYLAGLVIEKASGQSYADFIRKNFFDKLGMKATSLGCPGVEGHELKFGRARPAKAIDWNTPFSAGGICSSVHDLLVWENALQTGSAISKNSLAAMTMPTRLTDGTDIDYGLGTRLGTLAGHAVVGHTGSGGGFSAVAEFYPKDKLAIAILSNTGEALSVTALAAQLARKVLGLPDATLHKNRKLTPSEIQRFIGTYDSDEGPVEMFADRDVLAVRLADTKQIVGALSYQGTDVFESAPDEFVIFLPRDKPALWGLRYVGGLMEDAKRRVNQATSKPAPHG